MTIQAVCRGGSFAVESVAAFAWNGWQASSGISGNLGLEYAYFSKIGRKSLQVNNFPSLFLLVFQTKMISKTTILAQ
ncbi:hypothetical protein [uncultured Marinobacter sp.]|uniref:hypothetical protein n=1 Tax=uncultured Marinobacter sp. TaxID=187379 RepID=UPI0030DC6DFC